MENIKSTDYKSLIDLNKKELIMQLGDQFNIPFAKEWKYDIKKNLIYTKVLIIYFDDNDIAKRIKIKCYLNF